MERVLDAALRCFTQRGIYDTTVQDLAALAEVSVGSIYHHFGARDRVAFALYCRCMESLLGAILAAVARHRDARRGVMALVRAYLEWVAANADAARFIYAAAAQTELLAKWREELLAFKQPLLAPILAWLEPHVSARTVIDLPPPLLEVVVIGPPAEFARRWLSGADGLDLDAALDVLPKTVWRSVAKSPGRRSYSVMPGCS